MIIASTFWAIQNSFVSAPNKVWVFKSILDARITTAIKIILCTVPIAVIDEVWIAIVRNFYPSVIENWWFWSIINVITNPMIIIWAIEQAGKAILPFLAPTIMLKEYDYFERFFYEVITLSILAEGHANWFVKKAFSHRSISEKHSWTAAQGFVSGSSLKITS